MPPNNDKKQPSETVLRLSALMQLAATTSVPSDTPNPHRTKFIRAEFDRLIEGQSPSGPD